MPVDPSSKSDSLPPASDGIPASATPVAAAPAADRRGRVVRLQVGARSSPLSLVQSRNGLDRIEAMLPDLACDLVPMSSPGDEDRQTDLRESDPDFFTRFLDDAVRDGRLDAAVHSAKDLPDPMPDDLDWVWLPWREDPRDAIVTRAKVLKMKDLPAAPVVGISSERRSDWTLSRWPDAVLKPIRGNIEHRIAQLDAGDYDVVIIAYAALLRLGLANRATEVVPLDELPTPAGQGYLAMTFRAGDARMQTLRSLFVKATRFVGGGPGDEGLCTLAGHDALTRADVCMYDALVSHDLLRHLPAHAESVFVGKRGRTYTVGRDEMQDMIETYQRQGRRLVHLKGGDPAIFGRLVEQTDGLTAKGLPFRVVPGVSSLTAASSATGLLLTRREINRGFTALTCRTADAGNLARIDADERRNMPLVFFMGVFKSGHIAAELMADGRSPDEPAAMVFGASMSEQTIITATLGTIAERLAEAPKHLPGLLIVGPTAAADYLFPPLGPLGGWRVLITGSQDLQPDSRCAIEDAGGYPISLPLIQLQTEPAAAHAVRAVADYDWLALTSPAAVRCFFELLDTADVDLRRLPKLIVNGPGTAAALRARGLLADAMPDTGFGSAEMLELAYTALKPGSRVLRLRSDQAGSDVADHLTRRGMTVDDVVLYHNAVVTHDRLPHFDAVFFASRSAVDAFVAAWGVDSLAKALAPDADPDASGANGDSGAGPAILAIGKPTTLALARHGLTPTVVAPQATVLDSVTALAAWRVNARLRRMPAAPAV